MPSTNESSHVPFAELASAVEVADEAWQRASRTAFERLRVADQELFELAIRALHSSERAADFFARKFVYADSGNCYAALAAGKRNLVVARLCEFIAGEAGTYT